jgi:hypothetical protein
VGVSKRFDNLQPACLGVFLVGSSSLPAAQLPFRDPALPIDKRVDDLLGRLTLDERIALLHQYAPAVERLGIASFRTGTEALHGVSWLGEATVFPQAVGLGATWDENLVHQVAEAVSIELRAFHYHRPTANGIGSNSLLAILREDARKEGKRYSFEDVLLISEVVSTSSARKDYDDCTAKYGRYGIPIYLVVDPYAQEVVLHTQPTATGYIAAHTHKYGTGKLPIPLADGRTFTLDLDELPRPDAEADAR